MDKNICEHLRINTKTLLFSVSIRLEAAAASEPEPKTKSQQGCSDIGKLCQENFGIKQVKFLSLINKQDLFFLFITYF